MRKNCEESKEIKKKKSKTSRAATSTESRVGQGRLEWQGEKKERSKKKEEMVVSSFAVGRQASGENGRC